MILFQGAIATNPVATMPVAAGPEALALTQIGTVPCLTWPLLRTVSTAAVAREVTTQPFAVCPPNQALAA
jgi:hypothetical protein